MRTIVYYILLGTACLLTACGVGGRAVPLSQGGDTLHLAYAENLRLVEYDDYTVATLRNPWDTLHQLHTYVLVPQDHPLPDSLPAGTVVRVPLRRSLVYSGVHAGLLAELGVAECIGGVCDARYMLQPFVKEALQRGDITDCGTGTHPDIERIIDLHPDAILLSPYQDNQGYGRIGKLDIPLIECADYLETSALGRAEWMRFYGRLYGVGPRADSIFARVDSTYQRLRTEAQLSSSHYTVLSDLMYGGVWYMSGARSSIGRLYADACATYAFRHLDQAGSVPLSFEAVYDKAAEADFWLIKYNRPQDMTYADLAAEHEGYTRFRAYRERHVWGCNTSRVPYYEETPFHPEYLLSDLIGILHPGTRRLEDMRYFTPLAE